MAEPDLVEPTTKMAKSSCPQTLDPLNSNPVNPEEERQTPQAQPPGKESRADDIANQVVARPPTAFTTPYSAALTKATREAQPFAELAIQSPRTGGPPRGASPTPSTSSQNQSFSRPVSIISNPFTSTEASPTPSKATVAQQDVRSETGSGGDSPHHQRNKSSKTPFPILTDLWQGSSAPVSFGLVPSPKKEQLPEGSPFRPISRSSTSSSPTRPTHTRRGSTLQAAASFLGLSSPRSGSTSPTRKPRVVDVESLNSFNPGGIDEIQNINLEAELLPEGRPSGHEAKAAAFDPLLGRSEGLFVRLREAYSAKTWELSATREQQGEEQEEMEQVKTREKHLKLQLNDMAGNLTEKQDKVKALMKELEEEKEERARIEETLERERSIRVVESTNEASLDEDEADSQRKPDKSEHEEIFSADNVESEFRLLAGDDPGNSSDEENSAGGSIFDGTRPLSEASRPSTAPDMDVAGDHSTQQRPMQRKSMIWEEAAPYLPPEALLRDENQRLRKRLAELEETVQMCLGLVQD